jgi:hypothetical protein
MKNLNLVLIGISSVMSISLAISFGVTGNSEASGGWGMAAVWSMNSFVYQLRDK